MAADNEGGAADLSQDDLGDVAGVVAAVDIEAVEETRLAKDNQELVRERAVLAELMLALVAAETAQHAAHEVN